jgi:hypothetical protein
MQDNKIEFKFNLSDVSNKFLFHLRETTDCITHIYNSIENSSIDRYRPLPTDSFPLQIDDKRPIPSIEEQKLNTINWILNKAFEEFINGLTKSFKETYRYLKIYSLSLEPRNSSKREDFEKILDKVEVDIEKFSFPEFLDKIELLLRQPLPLKEEISSINKIRNCLVHRHGLVGEKDIKTSPTKDLRLKWISLKYWTNIEGEQMEITYNFRKDSIIVKNLEIEQIRNEKVFKSGDKILLDINEFNHISYTCYQFITRLYTLMPIPTEENKNGAQ